MNVVHNDLFKEETEREQLFPNKGIQLLKMQTKKQNYGFPLKCIQK